jgi:hypothetical protein
LTRKKSCYGPAPDIRGTVHSYWLERRQQDAGLLLQLARDPLQDWQQAGPGAGDHVPRLLCTEGPLQVPERHGRHDAQARKHSPARLGADHGRGHKRPQEPLVQVA